MMPKRKRSTWRTTPSSGWVPLSGRRIYRRHFVSTQVDARIVRVNTHYRHDPRSPWRVALEVRTKLTLIMHTQRTKMEERKCLNCTEVSPKESVRAEAWVLDEKSCRSHKSSATRDRGVSHTIRTKNGSFTQADSGKHPRQLRTQLLP